MKLVIKKFDFVGKQMKLMENLVLKMSISEGIVHGFVQVMGYAIQMDVCK